MSPANQARLQELSRSLTPLGASERQPQAGMAQQAGGKVPSHLSHMGHTDLIMIANAKVGRPRHLWAFTPS